MDIKSELELILSGSPEELKANLPLLLAVAQIVKHYSSQSTVINRPPVSPEFADYIMITFRWAGFSEVTHKNHTVEKSIRLKKVDPQKVSLPFLQQLGKKIIAKFGNKVYKTGHCKCKYPNWKQGIQTWGYFENEATGYQIIESIGDIGGFQIDKSLFRYEFVKDPSEAFDATPDKLIIANKPVRPKAKAPIANMTFVGSSITFPWIGHTEPLTSRSGILMSNLNFLQAYDD